MARGTKLHLLRQMFKAEAGMALEGGGADDTRLNWLLWNTQVWLASEYDWSFLAESADVVCSSRLANTLPTTLNYDRPVRVEVLWTTIWQPVRSGVGTAEYNAVHEGDTQDPIRAWQDTGDGLFEVWPAPATSQTLRFSGQRALTTWLDANGNFVDANAAVLDDALIVLYAAVDQLSKTKGTNVQAKLEKAKRRLAKLRASDNVPHNRIYLSGPPEQTRVVSVKVVAQA